MCNLLILKRPKTPQSDELQKSGQADQEKRVRVHGGGRTYFLNFKPDSQIRSSASLPRGEYSTESPAVKSKMGNESVSGWRAIQPSRASPLPSQLPRTPSGLLPNSRPYPQYFPDARLSGPILEALVSDCPLSDPCARHCYSGPFLTEEGLFATGDA